MHTYTATSLKVGNCGDALLTALFRASCDDAAEMIAREALGGGGAKVERLEGMQAAKANFAIMLAKVAHSVDRMLEEMQK